MNANATPFVPIFDSFEQEFAIQNSWIFEVSPFKILSDGDFPEWIKQEYPWLFTEMEMKTQLTDIQPSSEETFYDCIE